MGVQGGYVTYRVNTQTSMPTYPRSGSAVRRRFRDFVVGTSQIAYSCLCTAQDASFLPTQYSSTQEQALLISVLCEEALIVLLTII